MENIKFKYYAIGDDSKKVSCEIFTLDEIESYPKERIWNFAESLHENIVTYRNQYTGLKDKNGVEIYENDIVSFDNNEFNDRGVVIYDAPCFVVEGFFLIDNSLEVIGNIYENPDLLKG